jgi:hypothetical protein
MAMTMNQSSMTGPNRRPLRGAARLRREEGEQDHQRRRHHIGRQDVGDDIDAFERAQHRDGGGDDAVAIDQRGTEQAHDDQHARCARAPPKPAGDEGHQRQDAAFAVIVGTHHEDAIFDGDGDDERPDDERQQPHGRRRRRMAADRIHDGLVGVERARAEIAIDDPERRQGGGQRRRPFYRRGRHSGAARDLAIRHMHLPSPIARPTPWSRGVACHQGGPGSSGARLFPFNAAPLQHGWSFDGWAAYDSVLNVEKALPVFDLLLVALCLCGLLAWLAHAARRECDREGPVMVRATDRRPRA